MEIYRFWRMEGSSHHSMVWPSSAAATYGRYKAKTRHFAPATPKALDLPYAYSAGVRSIALGHKNSDTLENKLNP
jgi:hypothetical protein